MNIIIVSLFGLALGSFVNALVWRMREQEKAGKKGFKKPELSIVNGRSMCVHCKHELAWYDLVPVFSWLTLGGTCRYCKKTISWQYPVVELLVGALAVSSLMFWPYETSSALEWLMFVTWVIGLVPLVALVIYDLRWMIMPTSLIYVFDVLAVIFVTLLAISTKSWDVASSAVIGSIVIGGFFWIMYQISNGKWIGGGDVRYGFAMGAVLGWQKALFGLALASYLGTALVLVLLIMGKYRKKMRIPFGPFLITATYLSMLFGQQAIDWYKSLVGM
ncbi:MAG TPA: prepilin peptidase [Candidatus Saccharibacteria bacterium]|jgi:leader peptidase (prepilin peptidase)/N-methyltransferase|nr:leader peptidase (prepilin peptidase) / N-methyltransferase [Patescibacteria group bacterium]HMS30983.1 prepilin peptidase [Candidatus Saccharibacteria bacterium]